MTMLPIFGVNPQICFWQRFYASRLWVVLAAITALGVTIFSAPAFAERKTVIIAADAWCPYNCDEKSGKPGFMIDIAREIFGDNGYSVIYQNQSWTTALSNVTSGKIDAIVGAAAVEARDLRLAGEPLGENQTCFYTRTDDLFQYKAGMSLKSRRVGVISGYLYGTAIDQYLAKSRADYNLVQIVTGEKPLLQNIRKLKARRIDTLVENKIVMDFSMGHYRVDGLRRAGCEAPSSLYIAFSPKREDAGHLAEMINIGIRSMRKNGKMASILGSYGLTDWKSSNGSERTSK
jgi:polar amino acid transport system substrate-binding protein